MGSYMINGTTIEISGDTVTAGDVKQYLNSPSTHQVVATLPDGKDRFLQDKDLIPANVVDLSVLPTFRYGR